MPYPIPEGRIRYHASNKTVRVPIDEAALEELRRALERARELAETIDRPPVAENENLCGKRSLAPVFLLEEERLLGSDEAVTELSVKPVRLFPADDERLILHLTEADTRVGKRGEQILVKPRGEKRPPSPPTASRPWCCTVRSRSAAPRLASATAYSIVT